MSRSRCCTSLTAMDREERHGRCDGFIHAGSVGNQRHHRVSRLRRCRGTTQASNPPMFLRSCGIMIVRFWIFCSFRRHSSLSLHSSKSIPSTLSSVSWPDSSTMSILDPSTRKYNSVSRLVRLTIPFGTLVEHSIFRHIKCLNWTTFDGKQDILFLENVQYL
jgi:hypothetical protein